MKVTLSHEGKARGLCLWICVSCELPLRGSLENSTGQLRVAMEKCNPETVERNFLSESYCTLILVQAVNIVQIRIFLRFEGNVFNVCCECHRIYLIVWDAHF